MISGLQSQEVGAFSEAKAVVRIRSYIEAGKAAIETDDASNSITYRMSFVVFQTTMLRQPAEAPETPNGTS